MPASRPSTPRKRAASPGGVADSLASLAEQLVNKPLDLVVLTRERIQQALDDAAERGRVTRRDANELVSELVRLGREQTEDLLAPFGRAAGRGRGLPIEGYDDLTASQVTKRLGGLKPVELRRLRDYEARHANRKSVLAAIDRALR
jgi:hypothetical protein